jgi:hypothetical protein
MSVASGVPLRQYCWSQRSITISSSTKTARVRNVSSSIQEVAAATWPNAALILLRALRIVSLREVPKYRRYDDSSAAGSHTRWLAEDRATVNTGRHGPFIDGSFRPQRNWDGADAFLCQSDQRLPSALRELGNPGFRVQLVQPV